MNGFPALFGQICLRCYNLGAPPAQLNRYGVLQNPRFTQADARRHIVHVRVHCRFCRSNSCGSYRCAEAGSPIRCSNSMQAYFRRGHSVPNTASLHEVLPNASECVLQAACVAKTETGSTSHDGKAIQRRTHRARCAASNPPANARWSIVP
jgi:hypothetical protein